MESKASIGLDKPAGEAINHTQLYPATFESIDQSTKPIMNMIAVNIQQAVL